MNAFERAVERVLNGDEAVLAAAWRSFPSPYDVDEESDAALLEMLRAAILAALRAEP